MNDLREVRLALTLDDAPSIQDRDGGVRSRPERMDEIREALQGLGVRECTAFVIGAQALGHEARLARWRAAGYALGNHTFSHRHASALSPEELGDEVRRCDAVLHAFDARAGERMFRYPYSDRGRDRQARAVHDASVKALGYRIAHASTDLFDHRFEEPLAQGGGERVLARWCAAAERSVASSHTRCLRAFGRSVPLIAYGHFGDVGVRALPRLVTRLRERGVELCTLAAALDDDLYRRFAESPLPTGEVIGALVPAGIGARVRRRLAELSERLGLFGQRRLGPIWPS